MRDAPRPTVAIVDYGMGNLFSVVRACEVAGCAPFVTSESSALAAADIVVLPGVGAFGDAMKALRQRGLDDALRNVAASGKPLVGICLGMQLLMEESDEFGVHAGLGILPGRVIRLAPTAIRDGLVAKVPQVGWNAIVRPSVTPGDSWARTPLAGLRDGAMFYFVHSYQVVPAIPSDSCAIAMYGGASFVACVARGSIFGCQFHPERSGSVGLQVYRAFSTVSVASHATP